MEREASEVGRIRKYRKVSWSYEESIDGVMGNGGFTRFYELLNIQKNVIYHSSPWSKSAFSISTSSKT